MAKPKAPAKPKKIRCLYCEEVGRDCICIKPVKTVEMLDYRRNCEINRLHFLKTVKDKFEKETGKPWPI